MKKISVSTVLLLIATSGFAQSNVTLGGLDVDRSAAVEATSDALTIDQDTGTAVFTGNVIIAQGALRLAADKVDVLYSEETGDIVQLTATDNVVVTTATDAAEAQTAVYDVAAGIVTLTGDVLLTQGRSAISADRMVLDVDTGTATIEGRVRTVLQQGDDQ